MVSVRLQFVQLRGSSYRYRRRVPAEVREVIGAESWTKTWRPGTDLAIVAREAKRFAQLHDHLIEEAKIGQAESIAKRMIADRSQHWYLEHLEQSLEDYGQDWRQDPQTRRIVKAIEGGGTYEPEGMSLTAALERDRQVYSADKDPRPFKYAVDSFVNLNGDLDVTNNGGRTGRFGRFLGMGLSVAEAIDKMEGATLECLQILQVMRDATSRMRSVGALTEDLPLLDHMAAVALDGASVNVPFERFFGGNG